MTLAPVLLHVGAGLVSSYRDTIRTSLRRQYQQIMSGIGEQRASTDPPGCMHGYCMHAVLLFACSHLNGVGLNFGPIPVLAGHSSTAS